MANWLFYFLWLSCLAGVIVGVHYIIVERRDREPRYPVSLPEWPSYYLVDLNRPIDWEQEGWL